MDSLETSTMAIFWKDIHQILYPDPELTRLPPVVIPQCTWKYFDRTCEKVWSEQVILPWIQEMQDHGNFSLGLTDNYQIEGYPPMEGGIHSVKNSVETYVYPFFLFLGTVLTLPLIVLMYKFSYVVWSTCFFMAVTLVLDMVLLCVYCGNDWYLQVYQKSLSMEIISMSNASCKVYTFLMSFINYLSPWVMVVITADVYISMNYPHRIYRMCTRERANATLLLIVVLLTFINLHHFWTFGLTEKSVDMYQVVRWCHLTYQDRTMEVFTEKVQPYVDFLFTNLIPFLVTSILLLLVLCSFCLRLRHKQKYDIHHLKDYFLEVEALLQMRCLAVILCVWFVIVFLCRSMHQVLFLMFQDSDILDYDTVVTLQLTNNLLFYSFLSCKSLLFYLLSAKIRRYLLQCMISVYQAVTGHSQRYKIQQQSQNLIQEPEDIDTEIRISTDVLDTTDTEVKISTDVLDTTDTGIKISTDV
ncbi:uncharacterized protein LOC125663903 isoform X2 [Ostrea edulis]|uniref:uncharacterized protein LOC125663903 isoform X2 n=1 Tax=Ostrea edulis TaxID=37623 RepID=UPI0024AFB06D|nr:uncharacterized protein LOC125663903 isoform X2 [Ostrea edulis]